VPGAVYEEQTEALLSSRLGAAESAKDFVAETLTWATEETLGPKEPRGCLVMNTATEFAQRDPEIAAAVSRGLSEYHRVFAAAVRRGQEEGSIDADQEPAALASYLVTTMSGLRTMVKAGTRPSTLGEMVRLAMTTITT
jgi:TetR/AcrR family transcriptional repressor of nem operon